MTVDERIAALEAQVVELSRVVAEQQAKQRVWHSMARTLTCPACGGGSILHIKQVKEFIAHAQSIAMSLNPTTTMWRGPTPGDPLHVYVCKNCRLVEWRAETLDHVEPDGINIVELQRPDDDNDNVQANEPYR